MYAEIKSILGDSISVGQETVPVAHLRYKGDSKRFVTWTVISEMPSLCADDDDYYSTVTVDIDVYADGNFVSIINAVKELMKSNDWVWTEDSIEMYEEDTELYHKTISFEKERNL